MKNWLLTLLVLGYNFSRFFSVFSRREIDHFSRFSTRNSKSEKCASLRSTGTYAKVQGDYDSTAETLFHKSHTCNL